MYGSYQRFLIESARMQVEARRTKPVVRDQSEDRLQSRYIVFGKEIVDNDVVGYGVKTRLGETLLRPVFSSDFATKWALGMDAADARQAARKAAA